MLPGGVRSDLVEALCSSLLGPSNGEFERLAPDRDPRDEYIVGVLAPLPDVGGDDLDSAFRDIDAEDPAVEPGEEDGDDADEAAAPVAFSPSLDPRLLPHSMGITFVIAPYSAGNLKVAFTFARYNRDEDGFWTRQPYGGVWELDPGSNGQHEGPGQVRLRSFSRPVPGDSDLRRISVFLINDAPPVPNDRPAPTGTLVFQPQIRVVLPNVITLRDVLTTTAGQVGDPEARSLELLYLERPILARGHLCSATWRAIDPESDPSCRFTPLDLESIPVSDRPAFASPHVRSVHIPMLPVLSPAMNWPGQPGTEPELTPAKLAEAFEPQAIHKALHPLPTGYLEWLNRQSEQVGKLPPHLAPTAGLHIKLCGELADRMCAGIDLLVSNEEARLAFCFANQAMAMQADWQGRKMQWRPFQLAFIVMCIPGVAEREHVDREVCDLLWFPTGGGKTEAYLGLAAFTMALRQLRSKPDSSGRRTGGGVGVISRYTLRLLTVQQFRRALRMVLACEVLRVTRTESGTGWRPPGYSGREDFLWGTNRFSTGLWVGGGVTPNRMNKFGYPEVIPGALDQLQAGQTFSHGEPAQVPRCPACEAHLAIPQPRHGRQEHSAFRAGETVTLHLVVYVAGDRPRLSPDQLSNQSLNVLEVHLHDLPASGCYILSIRFVAGAEGVSAREVDEWWDQMVLPRLPQFSRIESTRASRPGYFLRTHKTGNRPKVFDFAIYCPSPDCPTARPWREGVPVSLAGDPEGWQEVIECFRDIAGSTHGCRVPIPAVTVDEQVYANPPSLLVATVDKFAQLAFQPQAASLFGNVDFYHPWHGYYRIKAPPGSVNPGSEHPTHAKLSQPVNGFDPPDLILQDELHLIDGPLGSMVGLYETAIDLLCRNSETSKGPKYIASTATVREAAAQVQSLFARKLTQFPAPGLRSDDNFFARIESESCGDEERSGRLYLGICAPGKGAQTPIVRIWSTLLQSVEEARCSGCDQVFLDNFFTLVGYFNAVRELAGASVLYRQDIDQRLRARHSQPRTLNEPLELSSRADAMLLPTLLSMLERRLPEAVDAVLATSMFGTGVDVDRLGLMVVHGQPKTTSSYIQATGRVGRRRGGLVVTFLRSSRPRDLDHYEFFTGYHQQLYRSVEPVTVAPFSPRARERALGPLCVALLRQARSLEGHPVATEWRVQQTGSGRSSVCGARRMANASQIPEVVALSEIFEQRAAMQPQSRRPGPGVVKSEVGGELDRWRTLAQQKPDLLYYEYALASEPSHPVVLGDAQHVQRKLKVAFKNAPNSLRDIEATTGFQV